MARLPIRRAEKICQLRPLTRQIGKTPASALVDRIIAQRRRDFQRQLAP